MLTLFSSFGQSFFYGLFKEDIRLTFNISNTTFGSIYGLVNVVSALSLMYFGRFIDRFPLRKFTLLSFFVLGTGCLTMSLAGTYSLFIVALFLTRFGGQGLLIHTNSTSMGRYFHETRGRALALTALGVHFGSLIFPLTVIYLKKGLDWQQCWLAFALVLLLAILPFVLWLLKGHDARHKDWEDAELQRQENNKDAVITDFSAKQLLKDLKFYMMIPALLINPIICTGIFFYIQNVASAKSWSMELIAFAYGANAISTIIFTIIGGFLVDRFSARRLFIFLPIPMTIALLTLAMFSAPFIAYLFMVLIGLSVGIFSSTSGSIWAEMYGTKHLGSIRSLFGMFMVLSTALMPPIMGYFFDLNVDIETIAYGLIGYVLVAAIIASPVSLPAWLPKHGPVKADT
jgi:MFS family permease